MKLLIVLGGLGLVVSASCGSAVIGGAPTGLYCEEIGGGVCECQVVDNPPPTVTACPPAAGFQCCASDDWPSSGTCNCYSDEGDEFEYCDALPVTVFSCAGLD